MSGQILLYILMWKFIAKSYHKAWLKNRTAANYAKWRNAVAHITQLQQEAAAAKTKRGAAVTTVSLNGAKAIAAWEGGRSSDGKFHPYRDPVTGVWTIGYGHTHFDGAPVPAPGTQPLSSAEATTLLLHDLQTRYAPAVRKALKGYNMAATQKQFDALTSFCYNVGPKFFLPSHDIGDAMKQGDGHLVAQRLLEYDKADGRVVEGLKRRRQWEAQLFQGGHYSL